MYVAKGARKIPNIHLQGTTNAYVSKIKFLGKHIKDRLTLKDHYDEVISSCKTSLRALMLQEMVYIQR